MTRCLARLLTGFAVLAALSACAPRPGTAPPPPKLGAAFTDVTSAAGISFNHETGAFGGKYYPERMGAGGGFIDANGDGLLDIVLVDGTAMPGHPKPPRGRNRLFLNRGDGTFANRSVGSGLEQPGYGMGVAVGDVDNDGRDDLYITRVGTNSLYLNRGGHFREAIAAAGLALRGFSTSAAFLDYDADGLLDLYVCRYIPWTSPKDEVGCLNARGQRDYCSVHAYGGMEHALYRNLGVRKGVPRFQDVSREAGLKGHVGRGLAVACSDYDRDGDTDLFVANDETPNFLWRNDGRGRFTECAAVAGFAYNERGNATAGMGLDIADADGDGTDDVIESDFQGQRKTLYLNNGAGSFTPNEGNKGLRDMPVNRLGFGIGFLDYDLDGWPDIFIANGHVNDRIAEGNAGVSFAQTAQLFRNGGGGAYTDASDRLGAYGRTPLVGRGTAFGDYDNDGDTDLLVMNNGGPAVLLRNDFPRRNHWIGFRCIGTRSNRSGLGVRLDVECSGRRLTRETRSASSYLSASDPRVLFGLGAAESVVQVVLSWPGGEQQRYSNLAVDRYYTFREGDSSWVRER